MRALKLAEADKGPGLAEMVQQAYMAGVTEYEIKKWLKYAIEIHKGKVHTILTQRDYNNPKQLYIKDLKP